MLQKELKEHFRQVTLAIQGSTDVVPFLGAGVNLAGRDKDAEFDPRGEYLPSGGELARYLAERFDYPKPVPCPHPGCVMPGSCTDEACPDPGRTRPVLDLLKVSQYAATSQGSGELNRELGTVFGSDAYKTTVVHTFLAQLVDLLEARRERDVAAGKLGKKIASHALILTTNYDDALERALEPREFDLVWYDSARRDTGRFWHKRPGATSPIPIEPKYDPALLEERPVVVKLHGAIDRAGRWDDSFVITEDDYSDYLMLPPEASLPLGLRDRLLRSRMLFLGYSLLDWNMRVLLHRIRLEQALDERSWAVQQGPSEVDRKLWNKRAVDVLDAELGAYVHELAEALDLTPAA